MIIELLPNLLKNVILFTQIIFKAFYQIIRNTTSIEEIRIGQLFVIIVEEKFVHAQS